MSPKKNKKMAITVRAVGTSAKGTGAIAPGLPAGTAVDDILVMVVESGVGSLTVSGWTEATNSPQSDATDATQLSVFWRRATGTDATTTSIPTNHAIGRIIGFTGCVTQGNPFNVTAGGTEATSDTSGSIPSATTTIADTMVVLAWCSTQDANSTNTEFSSLTNSNLASLTEQVDNGAADGAGGAIGAGTGTWATVGDYGTSTVTYANASRKGLWSGALIPAISIDAASNSGYKTASSSYS